MVAGPTGYHTSWDSRLETKGMEADMALLGDAWSFFFQASMVFLLTQYSASAQGQTLDLPTVANPPVLARHQSLATAHISALARHSPRFAAAQSFFFLRFRNSPWGQIWQYLHAAALLQPFSFQSQAHGWHAGSPLASNKPCFSDPLDKRPICESLPSAPLAPSAASMAPSLPEPRREVSSPELSSR